MSLGFCQGYTWTAERRSRLKPHVKSYTERRLGHGLKSVLVFQRIRRL